MNTTQKRQIVFIMTDTQRWDMVGCYGRAEMRTPCLDRLAGEGIRFDRAYTCQPVCGPARAAIFTGTWPHSNGSWGNSMPLGDTVKTVGQRLRDRGFHTAYIGKWHLDGSDYFGNSRCPDGWDEKYWYDMRRYLEELTPEERQHSRDCSILDKEDVPEEFTYGHRCANRARDFLSHTAEEDFLLVVSFDEPHHPFLCPQKFIEPFRDYTWPQGANVRDTLADKPEHHRVWAKASGDLSSGKWKSLPWFLGCNSFVDYEIGRVLDAVNQYAPDALVIYTSDHGDAMGAHRISNKGPVMYDEVTRIPLIVRWPGNAPSQSVCTHPVSHIDLVPTLLDFAGSSGKGLEGASMLETLRDPARRPADAIFMEFGRYEVDHDGFGGFQPVRCAFDGRYKLVINLLCTDELYDLEKDPQELQNLIDSPAHARERDRLHDRLIRWMDDTRDPFRGYYWQRRPWRSDASEASWWCNGMTRQRDSDYEPRQLDYATGLEIRELVRRK